MVRVGQKKQLKDIDVVGSQDRLKLKINNNDFHAIISLEESDVIQLVLEMDDWLDSVNSGKKIAELQHA